MQVSYAKHEASTSLDRVTCKCGDAVVEIRDEGGRLIVFIQNAKVSIEPRAAAVWLEVEER